MITKYNNISLIAGVPGFLLQSAGTILTDYMKNENTIGYLFVLIGSSLLMVGFAFYAKAKGRHPAWCLMTFLSLLGLIILATLTDKTKNINQPDIGNRSV